MRRRLLLAIPLVIAGFPALPAAADELNTLNALVGGAVTYDSNLFRSPDFANPQSDVITTGYVGLRVDKSYAQQLLQLYITETAYRYDKFSHLNFNGLDYRGAWRWHLSPRVSGALTADRSEGLVSFSEDPATIRNVRVTKNSAFSLDGWVSGRWHLIGGISQSDQKSEHPSQSTPDFHSVGGDAGVKYLVPSGSWLSVVQRAIRGKYLNQSVVDPANPSVNDNYHQYETEFQANWILTAKSTVTGRLTWLERRNDNFTQGDFSGLGGKFNYIWKPTSKLSLDFGAERAISPWQENDITYKIDNISSFVPRWQASAKVAVYARLEHIQSYFHGGPATNAPLRSDTTNNALAGVDWSPLRSFKIGTSLQRQQRSSSIITQEYNATVAYVGASLMF